MNYDVINSLKLTGEVSKSQKVTGSTTPSMAVESGSYGAKDEADYIWQTATKRPEFITLPQYLKPYLQLLNHSTEAVWLWHYQVPQLAKMIAFSKVRSPHLISKISTIISPNLYLKLAAYHYLFNIFDFCFDAPLTCLGMNRVAQELESSWEEAYLMNYTQVAVDTDTSELLSSERGYQSCIYGLKSSQVADQDAHLTDLRSEHDRPFNSLPSRRYSRFGKELVQASRSLTPSPIHNHDGRGKSELHGLIAEIFDLAQRCYIQQESVTAQLTIGAKTFPLTITPIVSSQETSPYLMMLCTDVSNWAWHRVLNQNRMSQTLLQDISQMFHQAEPHPYENLERVLSNVLMRVSIATGWDYSELWIPNHTGTELEVTPIWYGRSERVRRFRKVSEQLRFRVGQGLPGRVWQTGKAEWNTDLSTQPIELFLRTRVAQQVGLRAGLGVPVHANGRLVGVLVFLMMSARHHDQALVQLVKTIADQMGAFIRQQQTEQALRQAELKYRSIVENAVDGIFQTTVDGQYIMVNPRLARMYGYESPEALMDSIQSIGDQLYVHPERRSQFMHQLQTRDTVRNFESEVYRADGSRLWISESARAIYDEAGQLVGYEGTVSDITDRKRLEASMLRHDQLQAGIATAISCLLHHVDPTCAIQSALNQLGQAVQADRLSIVQLSEGNGSPSAHRSISSSELPQQFEWQQHPQTSRWDLSVVIDLAALQQGKVLHGVIPQPIATQTALSTDTEIAWGLRKDVLDPLSSSSPAPESPTAPAVTSPPISMPTGTVTNGSNHGSNQTPQQSYFEDLTHSITGMRSKSSLQPMQLQCYVVAPIFVNRQLWGYLTFEDHVWDANTLPPVDRSPSLSSVNSWMSALSRSPEISVNIAITDRPVTDQPSTDHPITDHPVIDRSVTDRLAANNPTTHYPATHGTPPKVSDQFAFLSDRELPVLSVLATSIGGALQRYYADQVIRRQAFYDELTGLPNRNLLARQLNQALDVAKTNDSEFAVMFLDLDRFKLVNDTLGHQVGDQLLQQVALRLQGCVRQGDTIARWGGDEFVILLCDLSDKQDAIQTAQCILQELQQPIEVDRHCLYVSCSIGISLYPEHSRSAELLMQYADMALYQVKDLGRNDYNIYSPMMTTRASEWLTLESALHNALERDEFYLRYQPRVNLTSGQVMGMEALISWCHPELGVVAPDRFIHLAEDTGLIVDIGRWVLEKACRQMKLWLDAGFPLASIAVNLSARQFQQPNLLEMIDETLKAVQLQPKHLELEITENIAMRDVDFTCKTLEKLRSKGIKIALDDFGIGYASLSYLTLFPFDTLKIDRSFTQKLTTSKTELAIARAIVDLGHELNLNVVAEGVETEEQRTILERLSCEEIQGYLTGKPLISPEATQFLKQHYCS